MITGAALRLPGLVSKPLWYDEAFSVLLASKSLPAILRGTIADVHPPGYYFLLHWWFQLFGSTVLSSRAFSLLCGVGVIVAGYALASRWVNRKAASSAAWVLALSPFQVHYAQEARMYSLLAFVLLIASVVMWDGLQNDGEWRWVVFATLVALSLYTHTLAVFYLIPLVLIPLWRRQGSKLFGMLLAGLGGLVLYLPWGLQALRQFDSVKASYWIETPDLQSLVRTYLVFMGGLPVSDTILPVLLFTSLLAGAFAVWLALRSILEAPNSQRAWLWASYLAIAPVALMFVVSLRWPVYLERGLIASGAVGLIGIAAAFSNSRMPTLFRVTGWGTLLVTFTLGLGGYFTYRGFPYAPFDALNEKLAREIQTEEIVLHSSKLSALPSFLDDPAIDHRFLPDPAGSPNDTLSATSQEVLGFEAVASFEAAVDSRPGVWLVIFTREIEEYQQLGYPEHPLTVQLEECYSSVEQSTVGTLELFHFR